MQLRICILSTCVVLILLHSLPTPWLLLLLDATSNFLHSYSPPLQHCRFITIAIYKQNHRLNPGYMQVFFNTYCPAHPKRA